MEKIRCTKSYFICFIIFLSGCSSGDGGNTAPQPSLSNYWQPFLITKPTSLNPQTIKLVGTKLIMWGGNSGSTYYATGELYDFATESWLTMPTAPTAGDGFTSNTRFFDICGLSSSAFGATYDSVNNLWQTINAYKGCVASIFENQFFGFKTLIRGTGGFYQIDSAIASYNTSRIVADPGTMPSGFTPLTAFNATKIYNWDGSRNQGYFYDSSYSITSMPSQSVVPARAFSFGAALGSKVYYWGGKLIIDFAAGIAPWQRDGIVYDSLTNTWASMGTSQGPQETVSTSQNNTFVIGTNLISVGTNSTELVIYKYDTVTKTWSDVSPINKPPLGNIFYVFSDSKAIIVLTNRIGTSYEGAKYFP